MRPPPTIIYQGHEYVMTREVMAALIADGLDAAGYEMLALVADYYGVTISSLLRWLAEEDADVR